MNVLKNLVSVLDKVRKPSRYIGNEYNAIYKKDADVRLCLVFPDLYDIGMSHFGLHILYDIVNSSDFASCERSYLPWIDMQELMRESSIPLYSYESYKPLKEFDVVGFTLQYEMSYTNVLRALRLSNIPLHNTERSDSDPIVIAGGPCTVNLNPMKKFIDAFLIGDGEEAILEMLAAVRAGAREEKLRKLSKISGIYVPGYSDKVSRRIVSEMGKAPRMQIVPYTSVVHDRAVVEILRGCTHGCRFCQAGMIYRPVRERSAEEIYDIANNVIRCTGYEEIGLLSLSSADHSQINEIVSLLKNLNDTSVSIPSTRVDAFSVKLANAVSSVRKSGITLAPEAGSQRLRDVINKGINDKEIFDALEHARRFGWKRVKLYFMLGLPTETDEDVMEIAEMLKRVKKLGFENVSATLGVFVPKPHTPFQFAEQIKPEEAWRRYKLISWANRFAKISFTDPRKALIEGILSRGGENICKVIEMAEERDLVFADWGEMFKPDEWLEVFEKCGIELEEIMSAKNLEYEFPWDFIDVGIYKKYLWAEYERALNGILTSDCREGCTKCGVCMNFDVRNILKGKGRIVPMPN